MEAIGILIIWILSVAFVALGNRSGSHSSEYKTSASYDTIIAKEKALNNLLKNIEIPEGREVALAIFCPDDRVFHVKIAYEKDGSECYKYLYAETLADMERQIKSC